ncbi:hypothetical protein BDK51DRAFT_30630, partial [Blyttiomyces helicus]
EAAVQAEIDAQNQLAIEAAEAAKKMKEEEKRRKYDKKRGHEADHSDAHPADAPKADLSTFHVLDKKLAGNMIYVTGLSSRASDDGVEQLFGKFGTIVDVILQPNQISGELEAIIEYDSADPVRKVASRTDLTLDSVPLTVVRCRPSGNLWNFSAHEEKDTLFVRNVYGISKKALREAFGKYGTVKEVRFRGRNDCAYVQFEDEASAAKGLALHKTTIEDKVLEVLISDPSRALPKTADPCEIFVTNLPLSIMKEDVEGFFSKIGKINQVRLLVKKEKPTGTAFVVFEEEGAAKEALTLNGTKFEGRALVVSVPDPNFRSNQATRGGARGGRVRGGGERGGQ